LSQASGPVAQLLNQFEKIFPDEETCAVYLRKQRWPGGFVCGACGGRRADLLKSRAYTYECRSCGRQTSITAGTVMHRTRLPLTLWFLAAQLIAVHPESASARRFEELLGIPYSTAWLMREKLRQSMNSINGQQLAGVVEVSLTELRLPCNDGVSTASRSGKIIVAVAMGSLEIRLAAIPDSTEASFATFIRTNVKPGSILRADPLIRLTDYRHDPEQFKLQTPFTFLWLRRYLRGRREPLDICLEKFIAHHNDLVRQISFDDVLGIATRHEPTTYWDIIGRSNPRQGLPTTRRRPRRRKTAAGMREDGSGTGES
jgi:transposase-like protein